MAAIFQRFIHNVSFFRSCTSILLFCLTVVGYQSTGEQTGVSGGPYVIKRYDTLWDLAYQFLGDPFRWSDIWNINRHIQDPHWIYPGDALAIPGRGIYDARGYDTLGQDSYALTAKEKIAKYFGPKSSGDQSGDDQSEVDKSGSGDLFSSVIKGLIENDRLGPEMLRQVSYLWTKRDIKDLVSPGNAYIDGDKDKPIYHQFDRVHCTVFDRISYTVGDTVDIIHSERYLKYNGELVNLVRRVALGRVEKITRDEKTSLKVIIIKAWDLVRNDDRIAPATRFTYHEIDEIVNAEKSIKGTVLERVEKTAAPYLYQTFIFNKGDHGGVQLGDLFLVLNVAKKKAEKPQALLACAVNIQERSSTLIIMRMFTDKLAAGDEVKLVKRIKFNETGLF